MKVSGFTIVRNAVKYDYPVVEAIQSILPLCDEVVVSVGNSEDDTLALIQSIPSPKIKIVHSVWDDTLRQGGQVLAVETNKAKAHISPHANWCLYIQADEVLHEDGYPALQQAMQQHAQNPAVEGLLLNYRHFYGSYSYVADAYNWYRKEIRVVKNDASVISWGDAQGFRKLNSRGKPEKLWVKPVSAYVHHYGWVKHPAAQQRKQESFHKMWHPDDWVKQHVVQASEYDYSQIDSLKEFKGTHPAVIQPRVNARNWPFSFDTSKSRMRLKYRIRRRLEELFGINVGEYRNYRILP